VALALLSISGSIVTASGRPFMAVVLVAISLLAGAVLAFILVPRAQPGPAMLSAAAGATSLGMLVGLAVALAYLRRRFAAGPPALSVLRVLLAAGLAVALARLIPGSGILVGLSAMAVAGVVYLAALLVLREFGATDREKLVKVLRRKRG
jgi:O-antigen/teichoic acid export membrane protein